MSDSRSFQMRAFWGGRPQTLGEFNDSMVRFMALLRKIHPTFRRPMLLKTDASTSAIEPLAEDLSNIERSLARSGWDRQFGGETGLLPDGSMSREGTSPVGFTFSANHGGWAFQPRSAELLILAGGRGSCMLLLTFPAEGDPEFQRMDFLKDLMSVAVDCFDPRVGTVDNRLLSSAFRARFPDFKAPAPPCWLNYFRDGGVRRDLPPEVECESLGSHGGVLVTVQRDPPSADDPAWLERAAAVYEALRPGGWFSK